MAASFIYIIHRGDFVRTGAEIHRVGRSAAPEKHIHQAYSAKGARLLYACLVDEPVACVRELLKRMRSDEVLGRGVQQRPDHGSHYFEGSLSTITEVVEEVVGRY
jgi:hypothetical protein